VTMYSPDRRTFLAASATALVGLSLPAEAIQSQDLTGLSLARASRLLRSKAVSSVQLTQACLDRIDKYNATLNAFITVTAEQALTTAREMDDAWRRGNWRGPLHGIPVALKDNMDTAGIRTTAGSKLFKDRVPSEDAEIVRRLKRAGAVILGKTNLHEFAYGGSSSVSYFGPVRNPWALDRVPGGSSGGSAAAIAADLCFGAVGTDTAGSIRMPASYCGIVGLKPTYGRVSNRGVIPLSWTLDHVGPLCKTAEDAAQLLAVIAGFDTSDPTSADVPSADYVRALRTRSASVRLGIPDAGLFAGLDPEVETAVNSAVTVLRRLTTSTKDVTLPSVGSLLPQIMGPEAYAYHSRWLAESPGKYQPQTRERLVGLAVSVTQEQYVAARRQCDLLRREVKNVFATVDVLVTPTVTGLPSMTEPIEQSAGLDPGRTRNTAPFDVLGLPVISVPCGFTSSGLPIGLQIIGAPFAEATVLAVARAYEEATDWHTRRPPGDFRPASREIKQERTSA
jgi:aspartyl-tRNA(Asn)/glutamyl-tRNA(Gln) amidotransferase subunit A